LVRLLAPILSFTTEEVWPYLGQTGSVHAARFPEPGSLTAGITVEQKHRAANWDKLIQVRDGVLKSLESARQEKFIGAPLEARVRLSANDELYALLQSYAPELPGLFIVSQVELHNHARQDLEVSVERARGIKCERCWKYTEDVGSSPRFPTVCAACAAAIEENFQSERQA
jgi:isoleucyl-tRNA synthetase